MNDGTGVMRIALLADIHGNSLALDAVLAHIKSQGGVDGYWVLGDLCAIGFDPAGVLERLTVLPNARFVRGNADRYVATGDRPAPTVDDTRKNPALAATLAEVAGNFGWTQGYLEACGWLDWLRSLPLEQRLALPDGTSVLLVHSAPGTDDGFGLNPSLSDDELRTSLIASNEQIICVGHFHMALDRKLDGKRIINPGSVSNNFPPDLRASYAILTANAEGYQVTYYRVDYDRQAVIDALRCSSNPGAGFAVLFMEGKIRASWLAKWDGSSYLPTLIG